MPEDPIHPSQKILRHAAKERGITPAFGDDSAMEAIVGHVEEVYGQEVESVFHELVSDLVHVDVHYLKPTKDRGTHVLFTTGMSDKAMKAPDDDPELAYAELFVELPGWWKVGEKEFRSESNYWPVRWLKQLARLPHEYDTWLGAFHTIPNGDPAEAYAPDTRFCCMMLCPPVGWEEKRWTLRVSEKKVVSFFMLVPLFAEEVAYKLKHGAEKLLEKFDAVDFDPSKAFDPTRANGCAKQKK